MNKKLALMWGILLWVVTLATSACGAVDTDSVSDGGSVDADSVNDGGLVDANSANDGGLVDANSANDGGSVDANNVNDGGSVGADSSDGSTCNAAVLAEITWPTTGTSSTAISSDGYFDRADVNPDSFEVFSGGPDGRNYLRIKNPASGAFWLINTEELLGDPDILVIRFWWRVGITLTVQTGIIW